MKPILITLFFTLCFCASVLSQTISISPDGSQQSICGAGPTTIAITSIKTSNGLGVGVCNFLWEVDGGTFENGATSITSFNTAGNHTITWDVASTSNSLKITANSCDIQALNGFSQSFDFNVKSVTNTNIVPLSPDQNLKTIPVNDRTVLTYKIKLISLGKATLEQNENFCDFYIWAFPNGWVAQGQTQISISRQEASINVKPDNCSFGTISVYGQICGTTSNVLNIPVSRSGAPDPVSFTAAPAVVYCGDRTPQTYTIAAVANISTFNWTIPSGWTGASTSNSITVTPSGTNGGAVSVQSVACGGNSSALSQDISLQLNSSTIVSGPSLVCTSGTFTVSNKPSGTSVSWSSSNTSLMTINAINGNATRVGTFSGPIGVSAKINECNLYAPVYNTWVGVPDPTNQAKVYMTQQYGVNPITLAASSGYNFAIDNVQGANSYNWFPPTGFSWLPYPSYGSLIALRTADVDGAYRLICQPQNDCGTGPSRFLRITITGGGGGGGIQQRIATTAFPNPATETLTVNLKEADSKEEAQVALSNKNMERVFFTQTIEKEISIPVGNLAEGVYFLKVQIGKEVTNKQVVVKH